MKGIILAGGKGTRLLPLTKNTNKHLLKIGNMEQILFPLKTLINSGIRDILIITQKKNFETFKKIIRNNLSTTININFSIVTKSIGTSHTLLKGKDFIKNEKCFVIYGDNIFLENFKYEVNNFKEGCLVFSKNVPDPTRFGILEVNKKHQVISLEEKPRVPKSNLALVGAFIFDQNLLTYLKKVKKSVRGEYELTDVIQMYLRAGRLRNKIISKEYFDIGTVDSYNEANKYFLKK